MRPRQTYVQYKSCVYASFVVYLIRSNRFTSNHSFPEPSCGFLAWPSSNCVTNVLSTDSLWANTPWCFVYFVSRLCTLHELETPSAGLPRFCTFIFNKSTAFAVQSPFLPFFQIPEGKFCYSLSNLYCTIPKKRCKSFQILLYYCKKFPSLTLSSNGRTSTTLTRPRFTKTQHNVLIYSSPDLFRATSAEENMASKGISSKQSPYLRGGGPVFTSHGHSIQRVLPKHECISLSISSQGLPCTFYLQFIFSFGKYFFVKHAVSLFQTLWRSGFHICNCFHHARAFPLKFGRVCMVYVRLKPLKQRCI